MSFIRLCPVALDASEEFFEHLSRGIERDLENLESTYICYTGMID
jgi:hypothetical protein